MILISLILLLAPALLIMIHLRKKRNIRLKEEFDQKVIQLSKYRRKK